MKLTPEQTAGLSELYLKHFSSLFYYAYAELHDPRLAEEAVHEVYVIACRKYEEVMAGEKPERWLRKALKYVLRNMVRSMIRTRNLITQESIESVAVPDEKARDAELDLDMRRILNAEEYRLYRLVYLEGMTLAAAAGRMGISESACKKRIQRMKEKIRKNYFKE